MFSFEYTKSHLLIYTRKLLSRLNDQASASFLSQEQQQVLEQMNGIINNIELELEGEVHIPLPRIAIYYDFLRMFDYNLTFDRTIPLELSMLGFQELLKDYEVLMSENLAASDSKRFVTTYQGVLCKKFLSANTLNKFCSDLIEGIDVLVNKGGILQQLICLLYERRIIIQNIQKMMMENEFHCFEAVELQSYYQIIMETKLDSFSLRDSFNLNELKARNQELQLYIEEKNQNLSYPVGLEPISSSDFCESVISWVHYISSWFAPEEVVYNDNQFQIEESPVVELHITSTNLEVLDFSVLGGSDF